MLTGSEGYWAWTDNSPYILKLCNCRNIVIGQETIHNFRDKENKNFIDCYQYAATYMIETVEY